jgi:hypothetical protein
MWESARITQIAPTERIRMKSANVITIEPRSEEMKKRARDAFYLAFVASLGGFLFGQDLVIISGAQIFMRDQFALTVREFGFATSNALLRCIAGPCLGVGLMRRSKVQRRPASCRTILSPCLSRTHFQNSSCARSNLRGAAVFSPSLCYGHSSRPR